MKSDFLRNCLTQFLYRIIYIIFYSFNEQPMTMRVVEIHEVSGLFQIDATTLVTVHHHNQRFDFGGLISSLRWRNIVFDDQERVMYIVFLVYVWAFQNFFPFR